MDHPAPSSLITFSSRLAGYDFKFESTWGLFSPKHIDEGTTLLASSLRLGPADNVFDLGCGYGPLGLVAARMAPLGSVHMVDKDFVAVDFAGRNATINGLTNTEAYLSNGFSAVPSDTLFEAVITNLPAKISHELVEIFLIDAYNHLSPGGQFYIVTISGLKDYIKRNLTQVFGNYDKLATSKTYTAAVARKAK
jgi:16S rRNA (guanine1207-N2)-methyltransferase